MVIVVESLIAKDALVISLAAVKVMLGVTAVLNSKPAGGLMTKVAPVPAAISALAPSVSMMEPSEVHPGNVALAAVSAEMLVPPEAAVIAMVANAFPWPATPAASPMST